MRHPHARAIPAALERASTGRALRNTRRIRGAESGRDETGLPPRRIRSVSAQLLSRLGTRALNISRSSPLDCNRCLHVIGPIERSLVWKIYKMALDRRGVAITLTARDHMNDQHGERKIDEDAGPRDFV